MYFREVLVQSLQSHLVLVFQSLVKLMVPVLTPCPHVIRPETLRTDVHALAFQARELQFESVSAMGVTTKFISKCV